MEESKVTIDLKTYTSLVIDHWFVEQIRRKLIAQKIGRSVDFADDQALDKDKFETVLVHEEEMPDAWCL